MKIQVTEVTSYCIGNGIKCIHSKQDFQDFLKLLLFIAFSIRL